VTFGRLVLVLSVKHRFTDGHATITFTEYELLTSIKSGIENEILLIII
jgi:hypothetical protein